MSPNPNPTPVSRRGRTRTHSPFFRLPTWSPEEKVDVEIPVEIPPEPVASRSRTVQFAENVEMRYYEPYRGHPEIVGRHTDETFPYTSFIAFGLFLLGLAAMTQDQYA